MSDANLIQFRQYSKNEKRHRPWSSLRALDASGGEQSARAQDPVRFALVGGLGRRSCHLAVGIKHESLAFLTSPFDEGKHESQCMALERSRRDHVLMGCCRREHCCDLRRCCSVDSARGENG